MMKADEIFDDANKILKRILKLLVVQGLELHKRGFPPQLVYDLRRGQVMINGVYRQLSSIEHRIVLDGYEITFVDNFINFYKALYKSRRNCISQFALRTIAEMGFQRCQILFSKTLSKKDISLYKLVVMLGDYGFMAPGRPEHARTFRKLLSESGNLFTDLQKKLFTNYIDSSENLDLTLHKLFTKKTRSFANLVQDDLYKKTSILPFFKKNIIDSFFSSFSHIVHGDVLLLIDVFSTKRPNQLILRVYWVLLFSGINMINHISEYLGNSKIKNKVNRLNKDFDVVAKIVQANWSSI